MVSVLINGIITIIAFVVGALVGALLPRYLARKGKIQCDAHVLDSFASGIGGPIEEKPTLPIDKDIFSSAIDITFSFDADLFNEKEIPTGLRNVAILFSTRDGKREMRQPVYKRKDLLRNDGRISPSMLEEIRTIEEIKTIELPSGYFVHLELTTGFGQTLGEEDKKEVIFQFEQASLVGELPGGREYRERINFPEKFPGVFRNI